jgi:hypothetical protein
MGSSVKSLIISTLLCFIDSPACCAELSAREIVAKSISNYDNDWKAALDFTCTEHEVVKDAAGRVKNTEVSQIMVLDGTPYTRLIGKNGHPVTGEEAARENEKYLRVSAVRDRETAGQRAHRLRKYQEEREFLHEIPDAFNMKLVGHETLNGRANYLFQLTPKPGYVPQSKNAHLFSDIEGKLWIDEQDLRWTKAEANVIDTISIGWVLARIGPGAHIAMKQVKVDGEHWLPREIDVDGSAKILLVKNRALHETVSFTDYKRVRPPAGTVAAGNQ